MRRPRISADGRAWKSFRTWGRSTTSATTTTTTTDRPPTPGPSGTPLRWIGTADLSGLQGRAIMLHFRMRCAKVFAYRIGSGLGREGKATVETTVD